MQNAKQNPTQQKEQPWREDIKTKNQQKKAKQNKKTSTNKTLQ